MPKVTQQVVAQLENGTPISHLPSLLSSERPHVFPEHLLGSETQPEGGALGTQGKKEWGNLPIFLERGTCPGPSLTPAKRNVPFHVGRGLRVTGSGTQSPTCLTPPPLLPPLFTEMLPLGFPKLWGAGKGLLRLLSWRQQRQKLRPDPSWEGLGRGREWGPGRGLGSSCCCLRKLYEAKGGGPE